MVLHPTFQGGDHYFSASALIYTMSQGCEHYIGTTYLNQLHCVTKHTLHPSYRNGLYYWALPNSLCVLKPASEWGVEYSKSREFNRDDCGGVFSVHPDVLNFLPGGLSITRGPAFGRWEKIKTIINESNTPVTWQKKILKKVGYNKQKMKEISHNWKIGASATLESGKLTSLIAKFQLSFSAEYGGSQVNTENESCDEATEVEEQLTCELKPGESLHLWQYQLGLGDEPVLFCRDLKIDDEPNPPTEIPLAPANP